MFRALAFITLAASGLVHGAQAVRDYVLELPAEAADARAARLQQVALRRAGPIVIVHRGATAFAPENTLEAYAAAMDYGADGVEVDVRRTRDGILVLFHDDTLDWLTHGIGEVNQLTGRELLALQPRHAFGRPAGGLAPSFVQLLDLARQRAMLLHLDLKEPGLEADVARWLDTSDTWDHVVAINASNAARLVRHPRYRPLRYKSAGLHEGRRDLDPDTVTAALRQPGEMILVGDSRVATMVLQRPSYRPVIRQLTYRLIPAQPIAHPAANGGDFDPVRHLARLALRVNPESEAQLLDLLKRPLTGSPTAQTNDPAGLRARAAWIVERAWAANQFGQLGRRPRRVIDALERCVREPTPHPDWRWHRLDGALAARALGQIEAPGAAEVVLAALKAHDVGSDSGLLPAAGIPLARADTRWQRHLLAALGDLRSRAARRFLRDYVTPAGPTSGEPIAPMLEEATRALLRQGLAWDAIADLLRGPNATVRGTVLLECLDHATEERLLALRKAASWAQALPRAMGQPSIIEPSPARQPSTSVVKRSLSESTPK